MNSYNISFIGAGKLAGALCMEFYNLGYTINKVISKKGITASLLAKNCNAESSLIPDIPEITDIVFIAVPDREISDVLKELKCKGDTIIAHTAGSSGLGAFGNKYKHTGVFYPLQTFSEARKIDFSEVPFFIEASDIVTQLTLESIAGKLSRTVYVTNEETRRMVHLSAVFVSNFTNYILTEGMELVNKAGFSFETLVPLLNETIRKAIDAGPENSQTGPAVRNDISTIEKHLGLLSFSPELQNVYRELTTSIIKRYNK